MTHPLPTLPLPAFPQLADLSRASGNWLATLGMGLAVGLPIGVAADPLDSDEARPQPIWMRWLDANAEKPPVGENLYYKKGAGLEYRQEAKVGDNPIVMGIQGPLVKSKKDLEPGAKAYRKLAKLAAQVTAPGGFLLIASCSHNIPSERFAAECAAGVTRNGRVATLIRSAGAGPDHPVHPLLPESAYLKALVYALD